MGRVEQIVVENFKSYSGRVEVGPFRRFTCIIGPNGAGKSNLMDAMSFVLGVQAKVLRSGNLKELIYRKEGENPKKNERTAFVELTYKDDSSETSAEDLTLVFRRSILKTGEAKFQINGESVSQADYQKRLESINILSKARNFLVFQGDVEAVAQRQGKDLTNFFEQISGSEMYKEEYDQLAVEKYRLEENARYLFSKKRNALNEKKRVVQQKEEADEFRKMESSHKQLTAEYYLFRLHGISKQLEESYVNKANAKKELVALQKKLSACQKEQERADRERAQAHLNVQQAERKFLSTRSNLDRLNPERISTRSRFNFLAKCIEDLKRDDAKIEDKKGQVEGQIRILEQEQSRLKAEEKELLDNMAARDLQFTPEQQQEFARVKRETEKITAASSDNIRQLDQQLKVVAAERAQAETDKREAEARGSMLRKRIEELAQNARACQATEKSESEKVKSCETRLRKLVEAADRHVEEADRLQQERQQLMDTVQDHVATEKQMAREREMAQVCSQLSSAIPGVFGRVFDLCKPAQKKLHVAVNVALGKYLDAIVVDTAETARNCVRYLKERLLAPMTFLPLNELRVPSIDPRLGELVAQERAARLALNCVNFDDRFARAFEFVLGGVVVTDSMADGRRMSFGEGRALGISFKVVTLAGEAIAKNGNLSVNSDAAKEGATRFDLSEADGAKQRLDALDRRLHELQRFATSAESDRANLLEEGQRSEARRNEAATRFKQCEDSRAHKEVELEQSKEALSQAQPTVKRLNDEENRLKKERENVEKRMSEAVRGYYADLSAAMGVEDVQKVEREWRRAKEAANTRLEAIVRHLRNINAELSMLQMTLQEGTEVSAKDLLPKLEQEAKECRVQEAKLEKETSALSSEIKTLEEQLRTYLDEEKEKDRVLSKIRQETKEQRQQAMVIEKQLNDLDSEVRTLAEGKSDILKQSVLEDIELPLLDDAMGMLQDLADQPAQDVASATQEYAPGSEEASRVKVDFSTLPPEKAAASVGPAAKMLEEEYLAEIDRLKLEMKRLSPNLKALEQLKTVSEGMSKASKEADVARREIESLEVRFETVKKARKDRFLDCFQKVASEISNVYKRLTANTAGLHSEGGAAYLDLEDTEEPFLAGVRFTAMPPSKGFRDMHLLSGGEKTLAAMALLFAVHAYQKPPFMVLDEVDAALDANNVRALAGYVEQADCQTIVISLKDRFFVRGDALVGVWKNKPKETSAVLTLDLTQYAPGEVA
mmetsp:Transcript_6460/g.13994  ORF Transcript_6460/g.13994 Transcript_6460/m.13994 type:complete len:1237 (+) Transcript_6460:300-4010(+)